MELRTCIDVDDVPKAIRFYTAGLGLQVGRRFDETWVELVGASCPIDLLGKAAGTRPTPAPLIARDFSRHWTPVHLDFAVDDLDAAVSRCVAEGARLEGGPDEKRWGRIALLSDPFGNGFCLLQFRGRGYDALLSPGPHPDDAEST